ncbi:MAG: FAD:protein FMN transferase [Candidatus Zeuxoniibacter abyssi]|nr:MAG: FAD:protein FMN transferase [Candidatus Persebacteraceae bacterium AB1(2)]
MKKIIIAACVIISGCANDIVTERETTVFGTRVVITVSGMPEEQAAAAIGKVFNHFRTMHRRFHAWREGELAAVNRAIAAAELPINISAPMSDMLALSADYGARSEHLFNPAIGRLVALWGFHADVMPDKPPAPGKISAFVANPPTLQDMILADGVLMDIHPRAQLDFGAIAKGVALDEAREILRSHQIHNALINIGGNILALGNNGGSPWRIELRPATTQPSLGVIILKDGEAVATSGGGERRFIYQGKVYHHILDWRSGESASSTAAAVVISDDAQNAGAISDAAATALVIANQREAARILQNFKISVALRLFNDGEKKTTAPMEKRLQR